MPRRFSSLLASLLTGAVLAALWAPLLFLHGQALADVPLARLVWSHFSPRLLLKTLELCAATALLSGGLGVPVAFLLARGPRALRGVGAVLTAIPLGVPPVLAAAPFFSLGGTQGSPLWPCALALALCYFPVVAFLVAAALQGISQAEEEAALALSAPLRAWLGVLGTRLWPSILAGAGLAATLTLWEMGAPDLLGFPALSSEVYRQLNAPSPLSDQNWRAALAALPIPLLALLFLSPLVRLRAFANTEAQPQAGRRNNAFLALCFLISPLFLIARFGRELDDAQGSWNAIAGNSDAIWNTVSTATLAATFCTLGALLLNLSWRSLSRRGRNSALLLTTLPGLFAPVVIAVSLLDFFNRPLFDALYDSPTGMILWGYGARFFPLAIALQFLAVARLNDDLLWAAQGLGASPLRALREVVVPLLKPALLGTFTLVWALCAGELTVTVLVQGPGGAPLTIPIFSFLHAGIASDVATLCLVLMGLCGGALGVAALIFRGARSY